MGRVNFVGYRGETDEYQPWSFRIILLLAACKTYIFWEVEFSELDVDMDDYPSRRTCSGLLVSKKSSSVDTKHQNSRICSTVGCSRKLNSMKGPQVRSFEKAKSTRHLFHPGETGKEIIGSSSIPPGSVNSPKKTCSQSRKKMSSHLEATDFEINIPDESVTVEKIGKAQAQEDHPITTEASSSSSVSQGRLGKKQTQSFVVGNREFTALGSSTKKHPSQGTKNGASGSRYNVGSFRRNSISDSVRSGCSSPGPSWGMGKKRSSEAKSSTSAKGKNISVPSFLDVRRIDNSNRAIYISESRNRVSDLCRHSDSASVRTQRLATGARLFEQENETGLQLTQSSSAMPALLPQSAIMFEGNETSLENQLSAEASSSHAYSSGHSGSGIDNMGSTRSTFPSEVGFTRSALSHYGLRRYNLETIAEVLLMLDRLQQDEELSYGQLLDLETNVFLGVLTFDDQHRDMRLDIDNMSYEELLALEERMGTVSTGLTEEELQKCLERNIYQSTCSASWTRDCKSSMDDDVKCSICQEEYNCGEEVGTLECDHRYHVDCIYKWLHLRNWCPICKASAAPS